MQAWLADNLPGLRAPVTLALISGGRSNLTYRVTDAAGSVRALRRPPTGSVLSTAHDMSREWRFLSALAPTAVPVPQPLAYCDDSAVTGAEFYVMDHLDGIVLGDREAAEPVPAPVRRKAGEQVIDVLAALHRVDPDSAGLTGSTRADSYLQRQLRRWRRQVHEVGAPDLALLDEVHDVLLAHVPEQQQSGIVHGDFRPGNMMFAADGSVLGVLDWELATLGDPLADLGWLLSTWEEPGDAFPPATDGPTGAGGFPRRAELVERYARLTGREVSNVAYYVAFARWRAACIEAGVRARYEAGVMGDDDYTASWRGSQGEAAFADLHALGLA